MLSQPTEQNLSHRLTQIDTDKEAGCQMLEEARPLSYEQIWGDPPRDERLL